MSPLPWSHFADLLLWISVGYGVLLVYSTRYWTHPATRWFQLVLAISMIWALTYYAEMTMTELEDKVTARMVRQVALPWMMPVWLALLGPLAGIGRSIPRWLWGSMIVFMAVMVVMALTMRHHELFLYGFSALPLPGAEHYSVLKFERGPVYQIYEFVSIVIISGSSILLMLRALPTASPLMRRQLLLLLAAYLLPLFSTTLYSLGYSPVSGLNPAPFLMLFSIMALGWSVLRYRALDLAPIARGVLLDTLPDIVVVFDDSGRIVDQNQAAERAFGAPAMDCIGRVAADLPGEWSCALSLGEGTFTLGATGEPRSFAINRQVIHDRRQQRIGELVCLRDITRERAAVQAMHDNAAQLRIILDNICEAVMVHDTDGNLISVNQRMLELYQIPDTKTALRYRIFDDLSAADAPVTEAMRIMESLQEGGRHVIPQWRSRRPLKGEVFPVRVELSSFYRANERLILATVIDLSETLAQQERELEYQRLLSQKRQLRQQEMLIRDLHDGVGGMVINIGLMATLASKVQDAAGRDAFLAKIAELANDANGEIRSLMDTLEARELHWQDIVAEMQRHGEAVIAAHPIAFRLQHAIPDGCACPDLFVGMSVLRIFREALSNVVRHSGASQVEVNLRISAEQFTMVIADNGDGLKPDQPGGRGLRNMRQRISELGGTLVTKQLYGLELTFSAPLPFNPIDSHDPDLHR